MKLIIISDQYVNPDHIVRVNQLYGSRYNTQVSLTGGRYVHLKESVSEVVDHIEREVRRQS